MNYYDEGLEALKYKLLAHEPLVSEIDEHGLCTLCRDGAKDLSLEETPTDEAVIWWCGMFGCSLDCHCEKTYKEYQNMAKTQVLSDGHYEILWNGGLTFEVKLFDKVINAFTAGEVPASVADAMIAADTWWKDVVEGDVIVEAGGKTITQELVREEYA